MSNSRKVYNTPVAYRIAKDNDVVYVSNKHTAILVFDNWANLCVTQLLSATISIYAVMPPTPWPTWSRRHIISLLNGCWHKSLVAYRKFEDGIPVSVKDFRNVKSWVDNYEYLTESIYETLNVNERAALNNALMYPQILQHILRSPHPSVAILALKIDGLSTYPDGTSSLKHLPKIWKYLKVDCSAFKK